MSDRLPPPHRNFIATMTVVIPLLLAVIGFLWNQSGRMSAMETNVANILTKITTDRADNEAEIKQRDVNTANELLAMGQRVTALESNRATSEQNQATTAAAISGLQAQTNAMQGAINDMRDGIRSIQSDVSAIARDNDPRIRSRAAKTPSN